MLKNCWHGKWHLKNQWSVSWLLFLIFDMLLCLSLFRLRKYIIQFQVHERLIVLHASSITKYMKIFTIWPNQECWGEYFFLNLWRNIVIYLKYSEPLWASYFKEQPLRRGIKINVCSILFNKIFRITVTWCQSQQKWPYWIHM